MNGDERIRYSVIRHSSSNLKPLFLRLIPAIRSNNCLSPPLHLQSFIDTYDFHLTSIPAQSSQMAAAGRMLSVIREELPTVVSELASTAKVSTEQVGRLGEMEIASTATTAGAGLNPLAVRQMASASIKEGGKYFAIQYGKS